jgi:hypothetical protein
MNQDRSCRWYLADEAGNVENECCHSAGHDGDHHVLFGYIPGSISAGTEGDDGTLVLPDADWKHPTGNPWSSHYAEAN